MSNGKDSSDFPGDNSLATRMDRCDQLENETNKLSDSISTSYAGQVIKEDKNTEVDGTWLRMKVKCKKYAGDINDDNNIGGDGRKTDDYDIIDSRRRRHRRVHRK